MTLEQQAYIQKRTVLLKILENLIGRWDLAEGLYVLVSYMEDSPEVLENIEKILVDATNNATSLVLKQKLHEWVQALQKMHKIEENEREEEKKNLQLSSLEMSLFI